MYLQEINYNFSICKVSEINCDIFQEEYSFVSKTDNEISIICKTEFVPKDSIKVENGWSCFRIAEDASFDKYGMIEFLSKVIASEKTSVLVVATYDTDYLFIKRDKFTDVKNALIKAGCQFICQP